MYNIIEHMYEETTVSAVSEYAKVKVFHRFSLIYSWTPWTIFFL